MRISYPTITYAFFFATLLIQTACFTPAISSFDSARLVEPGQVKAGGFYAAGINPWSGAEQSRQLHLGGSMTIGLLDRLAVKGRYERARRPAISNIFELDQYEYYDYLELGVRYGMIEDELAGGMQVGSYFIQGGTRLTTLRADIFYTTPSPRRKFEYTFYAQGLTYFDIPEFSSFAPIDVLFGQTVGISTDLDRWAVKINASTSLSMVFGAGISAEYRFGGGPTDLELAKAFDQRRK